MLLKKDILAAAVMVVVVSLSLGAQAAAAAAAAANPCCSFPCQNNGVCMTMGREDYVCDCVDTDFYGKNCDQPTFFKRIRMALRPDSETLHHLLVNSKYKWIWNIVNSLTFVQEWIMKKIYLARAHMVDTPNRFESDHEYITWDATSNMSYFARALPPIPKGCPTPMGVKGVSKLPEPQLLFEKFFKRRKMRPDPMGSSLLFSFFAQHFTHQFFKTDLKRGPGFQWGGHTVDASHVYGRDKHSENLLRAWEGGKMKMQVIHGESFPPYLQDAPVTMTYPPGLPPQLQFALGHEFFGLLPGLFVYATIWLREHNRVCDVLASVHPEWSDEQLFQTAKLVVIGETIKIVIEDYVQHLSSYNYHLVFRPEVLFGEDFQYHNQISVEFNHLYHWHPLMPDEFNISGTVYPMRDFMFHSELVVKHGVKAFVDSFSKQRAGRVGPFNHGPTTAKVLQETIAHGRQLRFQPFNQYRKRFNLKPYTSFEDLTGDKKMAAELKKLYGDIDALEFYVGMMVEKRREKALFGSSIVEIGGPFSVKGLLANPICSPRFWRPSTFGGDVGFDIVNTATLEKLFCQNIEGQCPTVSFRVPDYVEGEDEVMDSTSGSGGSSSSSSSQCAQEGGCHSEL